MENNNERRIIEMWKETNFNELAWNVPHRNGDTGYTREDKEYQVIVEWLNLGETLWTVREGNITTKRIGFGTASRYDVIAQYNHIRKSISWVFRERNVFSV